VKTLVEPRPPVFGLEPPNGESQIETQETASLNSSLADDQPSTAAAYNRIATPFAESKRRRPLETEQGELAAKSPRFGDDPDVEVELR